MADELMKKWSTQPGQPWKIGPHRAISGDCTDETVVRRLFESATPARFRMTCDPPCGVAYSAKNEFLNALDRGNRVQKPIANDQDPDVAPQIFSDGLRVAIMHAEKGASCYATAPEGPLLPDFNKSGFSFKVCWCVEEESVRAGTV